MKENRLNIILLVLIHLFIFVTPFTVKSFHRHAEHHHYLKSSSTTIHPYEKPCPICQFEFVTFIDERTPEYSIHIPVFHAVDIQAEAQVYNFPFIHFSHRAPPIV
jgi:hypothetical protein